MKKIFNTFKQINNSILKFWKWTFRILWILLISAFLIINLGRLPGREKLIYSESKVSGISCYADDKLSTENIYRPCDKFAAKDWVDYVDADNDDSKLVLWINGEPSAKPMFERNYSLKTGINNMKNLMLNPYQTDFAVVKNIWHLKHNLAYNGYKLKWDNVVEESEEYLDILNKLILHYKNQGKKVILAGYSYGADVVSDFIRKYGTVADGTVSLAGKLSTDNSKLYRWSKTMNQTRYTKNNEPNQSFSAFLLTTFVNFFSPESFALKIFSGVTNRNDFTKTIDPAKLTNKNIIWHSTYNDTNSGWYTQKEQDFAKKYGKLFFVSKEEVNKFLASVDKNKLMKELSISEGFYKILQDQLPHNILFMEPKRIFAVWEDVFNEL